MIKNIIIFLLLFLLAISVYFNYSYLMKEKREMENIVEKYAGFVVDSPVAIERGLKDNAPYYSYLEKIGSAFTLAEMIEVHPTYRNSGYKDVYTDILYDFRLLFNRAYYSENQEAEFQRLLEILEIITKHLSEETIKDPKDYHYAYISAQSEIRGKKLLDDETMGGYLGW